MASNNTGRDDAIRRRLLAYVVEHMNEGVVETARDAIGEILSNYPEGADELLKPIFELSTYWPEDLAKEALGLPLDAEDDLEELLRRFEAMELAEKAGASEQASWKEDENGSK